MSFRLKNPSAGLYYDKPISQNGFAMPKFFMFLGFWIGRFSEEESRPHVHVLKFGSSEAMKVWLEPEIEVEYIRGINTSRVSLKIRSDGFSVDEQNGQCRKI